MNAIKTSIALAALVLCGIASAQSSASANVGAAGVTSNAAAGGVAIGNGTSTAVAANTGYARTSVAGSGSADATQTTTYVPTTGNALFGTGTQTTTAHKEGEVNVQGVTETYNSSYVKTTQTGSALVGGVAVGTANAVAAGSGQFDTGSAQGAPQGSVNGFSAATSDSLAGSVQNGEATHEGGMLSAYNSTASAEQTNVTVNPGAKVFGVFVPTGQASQSSENIASTSVVGQAGSSGQYTNTNTGNGFGGLVNASVFGGSASATAGGVVASFHAN
jgi:hypothetical protein